MYITRVSPFGDHGVTSNARPTSVPNATSHTRPYGFQVSQYATHQELTAGSTSIFSEIVSKPKLELESLDGLEHWDTCIASV